jgi:phospholipid/cholesterol/gamma-HCH transport system permease protein
MSTWSGAGHAWQLTLAGDWRGQRTPLAPAPPDFASSPSAALRFDATALAAWDAALASALWRVLHGLDHPQLTINLSGLPTGLPDIVALALPSAGSAVPTSVPTTQDVGRFQRAWLHFVDAADARWHTTTTAALRSLSFLGEVQMALGRLLRGRSVMGWADLAWQLDQVGPRSLPIVALVNALVGLIVAYMGAAQLQRFGAQTYIADLMTVGVVREVAGLLVGIVLAGRVGAAFAAQIGSMRANDELDALQTLGVNPVDCLVLPRVLALLIVGPVLTAFAALVGMVVGWTVAVCLYNLSALEYAYQSVQALTTPLMLIGLFNGTVYALVVALAGCQQGLAAGRSAQAVGDATTAAVVQAIVWIVVSASALTVIFQRLDW